MSSGMLHRVTLVRTDVSEELSASFIRVSRIGELVTASIVPSSLILVTLIKEALGSSETSVLTRVTRRSIPEDTILHSHSRENLKSYSVQSFRNDVNKQTPWPLLRKRTKNIMSVLYVFLKIVRFLYRTIKRKTVEPRSYIHICGKVARRTASGFMREAVD
jgi:hypothetical protein